MRLSGVLVVPLSPSAFCNTNTRNQLPISQSSEIQNMKVPCAPRSATNPLIPVEVVGDSQFRIPLYFVWDLDVYESSPSTASTLKGVHGVLTTYINLSATCDMGTPTWLLSTGQSYSGINLALY
jgi:hypothetical protein